MSDLNLLELAARYGDADYLEWARKHLSDPELDVNAFVYQPVDVFEVILGVNQRIYQKWEARPDFPVREPARLSTKQTAPRIYSKEQVASIMLWYWLTYEEHPGKFHIIEVADRLFLSVSDARRLAKEGKIPMEGLFVDKQVFAEWMVGQVFD